MYQSFYVDFFFCYYVSISKECYILMRKPQKFQLLDFVSIIHKLLVEYKCVHLVVHMP